MSLSEIRDGFSTQFRKQISEGVERLFEQWSAPHADHLSEIRKVFDEHTGPMRERFDCVRCNETLILKHAQTMVGTEIHWTVTPEVWKVGGNPDSNFGPNAKPYFYTDDGLESATDDLMVAHEGHALEFGSTEKFAANDYVDMDGDE